MFSFDVCIKLRNKKILILSGNLQGRIRKGENNKRVSIDGHREIQRVKRS